MYGYRKCSTPREGDCLNHNTITNLSMYSFLSPFLHQSYSPHITSIVPNPNRPLHLRRLRRLTTAIPIDKHIRHSQALVFASRDIRWLIHLVALLVGLVRLERILHLVGVWVPGALGFGARLLVSCGCVSERKSEWILAQGREREDFFFIFIFWCWPHTSQGRDEFLDLVLDTRE